PDIYLPDVVKARGLEALTAQGIPTDTELWKLENFQAFLEYRRAELAQIVNNFLDGVVREGRRRTSNIADLVSGGEGPTLEFKQRVRSDRPTESSGRAL